MNIAPGHVSSGADGFRPTRGRRAAGPHRSHSVTSTFSVRFTAGTTQVALGSLTKKGRIMWSRLHASRPPGISSDRPGHAVVYSMTTSESQSIVMQVIQFKVGPPLWSDAGTSEFGAPGRTIGYSVAPGRILRPPRRRHVTSWPLGVTESAPVELGTEFIVRVPRANQP
jgi:hypothetical protein